MKRFACLTLVCASLALAACGKSPDKVVAVEGTTDAATQDLVKDATLQLNNACTGLNQYSYDLVKKSWTASVANNAGNAFNYRTEKWGWSKWVEIQVQVSPNAKNLPKEWNAPGQMLTYELGGGKTPGIATRDKLSQQMCGTMAVSSSPDDPYSHLDVSDLSSLDKLP